MSYKQSMVCLANSIINNGGFTKSTIQIEAIMEILSQRDTHNIVGIVNAIVINIIRQAESNKKLASVITTYQQTIANKSGGKKVLEKIAELETEYYTGIEEVKILAQRLINIANEN
jgi:hypothetical protein